MTDTTTPPDLELVVEAGPWGGPVFRYRGAEIQCLKGGLVYGLVMPGHPLDGHTFGVPGTIAPLVDRSIRDGRLPDHMRAVPMPGG
jgi:hypothetical protein